MSNSHFKNASLMRLQLPIVDSTEGICCANMSKGFGGEYGGEACGCKVDKYLYHSRLCKVGPSRVRTHNSIARCLAKELKQSGAATDLERHVPEMYKVSPQGAVTEAIADVTLRWPSEGLLTHVDVSVRAAGADRYLSQARRGIARAATVAEREKHDHYGPFMRPFAIEDGGRIGPQSLELLSELSLRAAAHSRGLTTSRPLMARLTQAIRRTLAFEQADAALACLGAYVGRAHSIAPHARG